MISLWRKRLQGYIQEMIQNKLETFYSDSSSCYIFYTCEEYDILIQLDIFYIDSWNFLLERISIYKNMVCDHPNCSCIQRVWVTNLFEPRTTFCISGIDQKIFMILLYSSSLLKFHENLYERMEVRLNCFIFLSMAT